MLAKLAKLAKLAQTGGLSLKIDRKFKTCTAPVLIHYKTFVVRVTPSSERINHCGNRNGHHHSTSFGQRLSRFSA